MLRIRVDGRSRARPLRTKTTARTSAASRAERGFRSNRISDVKQPYFASIGNTGYLPVQLSSGAIAGRSA
jgi:hypothetical protein